MTDAEIEALIARLRKTAKHVSEADRMMAESKSARNRAAGDIGANYGWVAPEGTDEWKAADALASLLAERDRLRGAGGISKRSLHAGRPVPRHGSGP